MFSYIHPEKRIPAYHPLRKIRELVREVLKELNHTFGRLYSHEGRPSIPPEQLLSALILQVLYSVRSERQLMEQLDYNLLFRCAGHRLSSSGRRSRAGRGVTGKPSRRTSKRGPARSPMYAAIVRFQRRALSLRALPSQREAF